MYKNLCFDQALSPYVAELRGCYVGSIATGQVCACAHNTVLRIGGEGHLSKMEHASMKPTEVYCWSLSRKRKTIRTCLHIYIMCVLACEHA